MARERLVETILTPNSAYVRLSPEESKALNESFARAGTRLNESTKTEVSKDELLKDLKSLRLHESVNSDVLDRVMKNLKEANINTSERKYYKFPIGRYGNVNANNRVYTKELWENVVTTQREAWEGLCGLCDHPEGDSPGYFKDSSIVWLDMEIDENNGLVYGIGTFVGPYGHLAQEIIDCGGRVGFSSSGFGEVGLNRVVDPKTYQIERVADIVLNPSQAVYGDNSAMNLEYNKSTPVAGTGTGLHESAPKSQILQVKEQSMANQSSVLTKVEEKTFIKYVNTFLKEADEIKNPSERLKELADILHTFDEGAAPELREQVQAKLVAERTKLEEMIADTVAFKEEFGIDSLKEFSENAKAVAMEAAYLNEENVNYKELCESLIAHNKELKQDITKMSLKLKLRESRIEKTTAKKNELSVYVDSKVDELNGKLKEARVSLGSLKEQNGKLSAGNNDLEKLTENLKRRLTTTLAERDQVTADMRTAATELKALREGKKTLNKDLISIREAKIVAETFAKKLASELALAKAKVSKLAESVAKVTEENTQLSGMVTRVQLKEARTRAEAEVAKQTLSALKEQVELDNTPDAHVLPKFEDRVNGFVNFRENKGINIEAYWADLFQKYGESITPYERHIRGAKTLREAQAAFFKNMKYIDSDAQAADEALVSHAVRGTDRKRMVESAGYKDEREDISDLTRVNERFMASMPKDFN